MRKAKYTDAEIVAAGIMLREQGKDVSPNAIKLQIGGGKASRIKEVWDDYIANSDGEADAIADLFDASDTFAMSVHSNIKGAAREVENIFKGLLEKIKRDTEARLDQLLEEQEHKHAFAMGRMQADAKVVQRQADQLRDNCDELWKKLKDAEKEVEQLTMSNARMSKEIVALKQKLAD